MHAQDFFFPNIQEYCRSRRMPSSGAWRRRYDRQCRAEKSVGNWVVSPSNGGKHCARQADENGSIESFSVSLRDELLNRLCSQLWPGQGLTCQVEGGLQQRSRPHSKPSWQTPVAFAATFYSPQDLALRSANGSAPDPAAHPAQAAVLTTGWESTSG
jgi:hypothetical protein